MVLREKLKFHFPVRIIQGTADTSVDIETANQLFNNIISTDMELIFLKNEDHRFSSVKALKLIERTLKNL